MEEKKKFIHRFVYLSGTDFDVEVASFIRNLENFRPGEAIDPQAVSVDEQPVCANAEHYVYSLRILGNVDRLSKKIKKRTLWDAGFQQGK